MSIEIKLLSNRRFIYANRKSNIVITAEHLATEITVLFPDEYEDYSKRVDFINSQGKAWTEGLYIPEHKEYPSPFNKSMFSFYLPNEVTTPGEMKMQFLAYKPDNSLTTVPFEIVPIYVDDGITVFKKGGKNTPDLLLLSYNQSTEALFLAQQAKAKANEAVIQSASAIDSANEAVATSNEAVKISEQAKQTAKDSLSDAAEAVLTAKTAEEKAEQAVLAADSSDKTASDAKSTAERALNTSNFAVNRANESVDIALTAERNSNRAVTESTIAMQYASEAEMKTSEALTKTRQAEEYAALANEKSDASVIESQTAKSIADAAKSTADTAVITANRASEDAMSVVERANSGEFKGEKGEPGKDGAAFAVGSLVGLKVDDNGDFYAYTAEQSDVDFRYNEESGELFLVYK